MDRSGIRRLHKNSYPCSAIIHQGVLVEFLCNQFLTYVVIDHRSLNGSCEINSCKSKYGVSHAKMSDTTNSAITIRCAEMSGLPQIFSLFYVARGNCARNLGFDVLPFRCCSASE